MRVTLRLFLLLPALVLAQTDSVPQENIPPDQTGMRSTSTVELSKEMTPGWCLGNSLDVPEGEKAWGNPMVNQELINGVAAAGFRSVRIPVAWSKFYDETTYTILPAWLARVKAVVDYVLKAGMYAVVNIHWDGGWIQPTVAEQEEVTRRLAAMWKQISIYFRDYPDFLLFAGMNEIQEEDNWGTPTEDNLTIQNGYLQTFLNTVRATGGRNTYRYLVVQGYRTDVDLATNVLAIPNDPTPNKLFVEAHYYDPYNFTINTGDSTTWQWGKNATDPNHFEDWAQEARADEQFQKMKTKFVDAGIGVYMGEYGVQSRQELATEAMNAEAAEYRRYYIEYVTTSMVNHGLIPVYWDNGVLEDRGMGLFDRHDGTPVYQDIIDAIMQSRPFVDVAPKGDLLNSQKQSGFSVRQSENLLQCTNPGSRESHAGIYTTSGQLIKTCRLEFGMSIIDIGSLTPGCYLFKVTHDYEKGNFTTRIIKP